MHLLYIVEKKYLARQFEFDSLGIFEVQIWRILDVVLFPILFNENVVIVVIRNDLVYQSVEVYVTSNKFQLTASFASKLQGASNLKLFQRDIGPSRILFGRNNQGGRFRYLVRRPVITFPILKGAKKQASTCSNRHPSLCQKRATLLPRVCKRMFPEGAPRFFGESRK